MDISERLKRLRADLAVTVEQLAFMEDDAEDKRLRSLVAETPLADVVPATPMVRPIEGPYRPTPTGIGRRHPVTADLPGAEATPNRLRMGEFPLGSRIVPNPVNRVPGFSIRNHWFVPGFPQMAWPMMEWVLDTHYAGFARPGATAEQAIIVRGAGEAAFVAGADISEFEQNRSTKEQIAAYEATSEEAGRRLAGPRGLDERPNASLAQRAPVRPTRRRARDGARLDHRADRVPQDQRI